MVFLNHIKLCFSSFGKLFFTQLLGKKFEQNYSKKVLNSGYYRKTKRAVSNKQFLIFKIKDKFQKIKEIFSEDLKFIYELKKKHKKINKFKKLMRAPLPCIYYKRNKLYGHFKHQR